MDARRRNARTNSFPARANPSRRGLPAAWRRGPGATRSTTRPGSRPCPWSRPIPSARRAGASSCSRSSPRSCAVPSATRRSPGSRSTWSARHGRLRGMVRAPAQAAARGPASLSDADAALVDHVTRHNPPWISGEYLSYRRPPVPEELLGRPAPPERAEPAAPRPRRRRRSPPRSPTCAPGSPACSTASPPRRPDELDLAEAVCAADLAQLGPLSRARSTSTCCAARSKAASLDGRDPGLARQPRVRRRLPGRADGHETLTRDRAFPCPAKPPI